MSSMNIYKMADELLICPLLTNHL